MFASLYFSRNSQLSLIGELAGDFRFSTEDLKSRQCVTVMGVMAMLNVHDVAGGINQMLQNLADVEIINSIACSGEDLLRLGSGIYLKACFFNHSCHPNASRINLGGNPAITFFAQKPILKGEEVTMGYLDVQPRYIRKRSLRALFGFECACELCRSPPPEYQHLCAIHCPVEDCDGIIDLDSTFRLMSEHRRVPLPKCQKCGSASVPLRDLCTKFDAFEECDRLLMAGSRASHERRVAELSAQLGKMTHLGFVPRSYQVIECHDRLQQHLSMMPGRAHQAVALAAGLLEFKTPLFGDHSLYPKHLLEIRLGNLMVKSYEEKKGIPGSGEILHDAISNLKVGVKGLSELVGESDLVQKTRRVIADLRLKVNVMEEEEEEEEATMDGAPTTTTVVVPPAMEPAVAPTVPSAPMSAAEAAALGPSGVAEVLEMRRRLPLEEEQQKKKTKKKRRKRKKKR